MNIEHHPNVFTNNVLTTTNKNPVQNYPINCRSGLKPEAKRETEQHQTRESGAQSEMP